MIFEPLELAGAWLVHQERLADERGFFARTICVKEFAARGLNGAFIQSSVSFNKVQGTVRGMHFQWPPFAETKLVRCVAGGIQDVLIDLRPESATFLRHLQVRLDAATGSAVYIPPGFAHGFQTLADGTEVQYHMTDEFQPGSAGGFRWNDPAFGIELGLPVAMISARDAGYAAFDRAAYLQELDRRR